MNRTVSLQEVLRLAGKLSLEDKVRLIERIAPQIQVELHNPPRKARKSIRGLWRGLEITDEDIAEVREEMWRRFPREDI